MLGLPQNQLLHQILWPMQPLKNLYSCFLPSQKKQGTCLKSVWRQSRTRKDVSGAIQLWTHEEQQRFWTMSANSLKWFIISSPPCHTKVYQKYLEKYQTLRADIIKEKQTEMNVEEPVSELIVNIYLSITTSIVTKTGKHVDDVSTLSLPSSML